MPANSISTVRRLSLCSPLFAGVVLSILNCGLAQTLPPPAAGSVDLCDLYQHPETYQGKIIQVYARISGPELELDDFPAKEACPARMRLKLEFPSEQVIDRMDIETRADVNVLRHRYHKNQVALIAGRFHAAYVHKGDQKLPVAGSPSQGYGLHHDFDGVILLQSLTEFTVLSDTHK